MKLTRVTLATASSVLLLATLAACGDDSGDDPATAGAGPGAIRQGPGGQPPGASGTVADVSGRTAQVQSDAGGQVAVSWDGDTEFTEEVDGTLDDVTVGACVVVTSDAEPGAPEVTATSVRVLDRCRQAPDGAPSGMPTDRPSDVPSDLPGDGAMRSFGTAGKVTARSGDGFTITGRDDGDVVVTVTGDTTYTTTASATAAAVRVGVCVAAQGETDDTGAVTASTISVSQPVDGVCSGAFVVRGGPGGAA